jgi:hypothetical protein
MLCTAAAPAPAWSISDGQTSDGQTGLSGQSVKQSWPPSRSASTYHPRGLGHHTLHSSSSTLRPESFKVRCCVQPKSEHLREGPALRVWVWGFGVWGLGFRV